MQMTIDFPADMDPRLVVVIRGCLAVDTKERWAAKVVRSKLTTIMRAKGWDNSITSTLEGPERFVKPACHHVIRISG